MKKPSPWVNLLLYQCIWFGSILLQNKFLLPAIVLLAVHMASRKDPRTELQVILVCGFIGILVDTALAAAGLYLFSPSVNVLGTPLWLFAIWLGFAATLRHGLRYFIDRPLLAGFAAALSAPLSYLAAARLGAVELPFGMLDTALAIALVWVVLMPLFSLIVSRVESSVTHTRTRKSKASVANAVD